MIEQGIIDRSTNDTDAFSENGDVRAAARNVTEALGRTGLGARLDYESDTYCRILVESSSPGRETTKVELANDSIRRPLVATPLGPALDPLDLAVNKVLALFGRAAARDLADLDALDPRFGLEHLVELARQADRGFSRQVMGEMAWRAAQEPDQRFPDGVDVAALKEWASQLAVALRDGEPLPPSPRRNMEAGR